MSNNQSLMMKYHPARKEIEFHRYQNGVEVDIPSHSKLRSYMNRRGKFVLQDYGNEFFHDIAKAFDALETVDIDVITTALDFEDFTQMIEYYNAQNPICRMKARLIATLPDMETTFEKVKAYGENAIEVLSCHKTLISAMGNAKPIVQKSADQFVQQIDKKVLDVRSKIDSLYDNHVSICFAGVYSAGKSALINAILGYAILPEAKTSETAKMFCISSPKRGEAVQIEFKIDDVRSILQWNDDTSSFLFVDGPVENETKAILQQLLNEERDAAKPQHIQIRAILSELNTHNDVSSSIRISFPVPLDNDQVQFTIYDTPGTDSNFEEHQEILYEALQEQKQSILVFVIHPEKSEGEGNNSLLEYLKKASKESTNTSIDIHRSLFVINHADEVKAVDREELRCKTILDSEDKSVSINLDDKKVLFTSALFAYAAKAISNNIASEEDEWHFDDCAKLIKSKSPYGPCYLQNRCAKSECSTLRIINESKKKLENAISSDDKVERLIICSGLYALEQEIKLYGERYASAVKTFAIIDSVDKALVGLKKEANMLREDNKRETDVIEHDISELRLAIDYAITSAYKEYSEYARMPLKPDVSKQLKLDARSITTLINEVKTHLENKLRGWFFGLGKVVIDNVNLSEIRSMLKRKTTAFEKAYRQQRSVILEAQRDRFIEKIKNAILQNSDISDEAKRYVLDIPDIMVDYANLSVDVNQICDSHKKIDNIFIFFSHEVLDSKELFIQDIEDDLLEIMEELANQFSNDYSQSLTAILDKAKAQFVENMESYSLQMQALIEDKGAMICLGERISDAADALAKCQDDLNEIIWREGTEGV